MTILRNWRLIEADLHERYGIDVGDPTVMRGRSWHWLRRRIQSLLDVPPNFIPDGRMIHATRIAHALFPPAEPKQRGG